jgi:hypothetical protein
MRSISHLTTLGVAAAACLFQNVSGSTLESPCTILEIEVAPHKNWVVQDNIFVCELQGDDAMLLGELPGSEPTVEINAADVMVLQAQAGSTTLHGKKIYTTPGLSIDADEILSFPVGATIVFAEDRRRLGDRDGIHSVVVVRVVADNAAPQHSRDVLSDKVFGTFSDPVNLRERYSSCSYGNMLMEPTNNTLAINGVVEVTVDTVITSGETTSRVVVNAATARLRELVGGEPGATPDSNIQATFRHVIMCLPTGTVLGGDDEW